MTWRIPHPFPRLCAIRDEPEGGSTLAGGVSDIPSNGDQGGAPPLEEGPGQIPTLSTSESVDTTAEPADLNPASPGEDNSTGDLIDAT